MELIKKHTLMVGLNDKDTKTQLISKEKARQTIMDIVGDCTISDAYGHYTHLDGTGVTEARLRVEMLFKQDNEVVNYARLIKKALNQESVALSASVDNSMLV